MFFLFVSCLHEGQSSIQTQNLSPKALLSMRRGERCSIECSDARFRQGATIPLPEGRQVGGAGRCLGK